MPLGNKPNLLVEDAHRELLVLAVDAFAFQSLLFLKHRLLLVYSSSNHPRISGRDAYNLLHEDVILVVYLVLYLLFAVHQEPLLPPDHWLTGVAYFVRCPHHQPHHVLLMSFVLQVLQFYHVRLCSYQSSVVWEHVSWLVLLADGRSSSLRVRVQLPCALRTFIYKTSLISFNSVHRDNSSKETSF